MSVFGLSHGLVNGGVFHQREIMHKNPSSSLSTITKVKKFCKIGHTLHLLDGSYVEAHSSFKSTLKI